MKIRVITVLRAADASTVSVPLYRVGRRVMRDIRVLHRDDGGWTLELVEDSPTHQLDADVRSELIDLVLDAVEKARAS